MCFIKFSESNTAALLEHALGALHQTDIKLSKETSRNWLAQGQPTVLDIGEMLTKQSEKDIIYFVISGCLSLSTAHLADQIAMPIIRGMCAYGFEMNPNQATFGESTFTAVTRTFLWGVSRQTYNEGLENAEISRGLMNLRVLEIAYTRVTCVAYSQRSIQKKMAQFLVILAHHCGFKGTPHVEIRMRHTDLALVTGLSRPYVSKALASFGNQGITKTSYGKIIILNELALIKKAGFSYYPKETIDVVFDGGQLDQYVHQ